MQVSTIETITTSMMKAVRPEATTRAVVTGITAIIASDGVFAVLCNALHI